MNLYDTYSIMEIQNVLSASVIVLFIISLKIRAEIITSTYEMQSLIDTQGAVIKSLEQYLKKEEEKLEFVKRYVQLSKEEYSRAIIDKENYLKNPINSYKLVKRLSQDLSSVEAMTRVDIQVKRSESVKYPTQEDFIGAVTGLIRLQELYDLNTTHLANGTLTGSFGENKILYTEYVAPMTITDCMEMGTVDDGKQNFNRSISWLKEALQKCRSGELMDTYITTEAQIIDAIVYACYKANDIKSQASWIKQRIQTKIDKDGESEIECILKYIEKFYKITIPYHSATWKKIKSADSMINEPALKDLCRGDVALSANVTKKLSCWYKSGPHPFLRLARVRTELLHRGPDVLLFHDVLTDKEIQHLQEQAKPHMVVPNVVEKSTVNADGTVNITKVSPSYRVAKVAWLKANLSKIVKKLRERTSYLSDLSMESAELLQVANYGIGGHYNVHTDFFKATDKNSSKWISTYNNRIATILFYMSEVEQGGATAFMCNLTIFPKKGSAIFWYNLLPNGEGDYSTKHLACPVLRGNKWALNWWFHAHGQEFIRPCLPKQKKNT